MKIEKISDSQIRCTLAISDLTSRKLQLSDLAYGSEKAKSLFQDIMKVALDEHGFKADDAPLMIEAVPNSNASITLIITKVDDAESLDSHFPAYKNALNEASDEQVFDQLEGTREFKKLQKESSGNKTRKRKLSKKNSNFKVKLFSFESLEEVIAAAKVIHLAYTSVNTLYKDSPNNLYILALTQGELEQDAFNRIVNILTEFGTLEVSNGVSLAYLEEHCDPISSGDAIHFLASLK